MYNLINSLKELSKENNVLLYHFENQYSEKNQDNEQKIKISFCLSFRERGIDICLPIYFEFLKAGINEYESNYLVVNFSMNRIHGLSNHDYDKLRYDTTGFLKENFPNDKEYFKKLIDLCCNEALLYLGNNKLKYILGTSFYLNDKELCHYLGLNNNLIKLN